MSEAYNKQILIKGKNVDKQLFYCVVLEPETEDLEGDVISSEEIEKTAHGYAVESRVVGYAHKKDSSGKIVLADADVVETFIAPVDFTIGAESIKKGSWVLGVKVNDSDLWQTIVKGDFDGVSIGGLGERVPM